MPRTTYLGTLFAVLARYKNIPEGCAIAHCLAKIEPGAPPTQRLIFPAGDFVTTKGTFLFDSEGAAATMTDWNEWTGGLPHHGSSDFEHDQASDKIPGHEKLDSSKYDLDLIDGALWAVNIVWTDLAADMILKGHKRFTSPWWLYEKASKRIIRYINFGLVSMPATIAQPELMAAAASAAGGVSVQVPDCFAGYASEVASTSIPSKVSSMAAKKPEEYKDPAFKPSMHGWDLRDMAAHAFANMQLAVRVHNEVPMLASAMGLGEHVAAMADHVSHCAAAMVHHMTAGEDDSPDEEVDASKLPPELAAKVTAAVAACKAAKCGGGRAGKALTSAAYAATGQKNKTDAAAALTAMQAAATASETASATALAAAKNEAAAAQARLATEQAAAAAKLATEQAAATAKLAAEQATAAAALAAEQTKRIAAEKAADHVKYNDLIEKNRTKVTKGAQEDWIRANILTSDALAGHIATLKPVVVSVQHDAAAAGLGSVHQTAEERKKIISEVELSASVLAAWVETGGGEDRLFNEQEKEAKRLGLVK